VLPSDEDGFVNIKAFVSSLKKLGLKLTNTDIDRLVTRFDVSGQRESCSVTRFITMVEGSFLWQTAEDTLAQQEAATAEASILRAELKAGSSSLKAGLGLSEDMISMAEHLGIKVLSEQYLLWIVREALNVPLSAQWIILKDGNGQAYFYNRSTNQSRWDHPLDPHYKELRDKSRQQSRQGMVPRIDSESEYSYRDIDNPSTHGNMGQRPHSSSDYNHVRNPPNYPSNRPISASNIEDKMSRLPALGSRPPHNPPTAQSYKPTPNSSSSSARPRAKSATGGRRPVPTSYWDPSHTTGGSSSFNSNINSNTNSNRNPNLSSNVYSNTNLNTNSNMILNMSSNLIANTNSNMNSIYTDNQKKKKPVGVYYNIESGFEGQSGIGRASSTNRVRATSAVGTRRTPSVVDKLININKNRK
jgi:hypothetical protein